MTSVLICLECLDGKLTDSSIGIAALGHSLAAGQQVDALVVGTLNEAELGRLAGIGKVYRAADASAGYVPEVYLAAVTKLIGLLDPSAVLFTYSTTGMEISGAAAQATGRALVSYCSTVKAKDDSFAATSLLFGGKVEAHTLASRGTIFAMLPSVSDGTATSAPPEVVPLDLGPGAARTRVIATHRPDPNATDLSKVDRIVSVGRGIGSKDSIDDARTLAELLGAEIAGSRPIIDAGWLPKERQVGKSGTKVKPRLYLALGISGAPEHLEGMSGSELIIAINSDANAPIFNAAHYGAVADMFDVMSELTDILGN